VIISKTVHETCSTLDCFACSKSYYEEIFDEDNMTSGSVFTHTFLKLYLELCALVYGQTSIEAVNLFVVENP
jgi:hypothetical protein